MSSDIMSSRHTPVPKVLSLAARVVAICFLVLQFSFAGVAAKFAGSHTDAGARDACFTTSWRGLLFSKLWRSDADCHRHHCGASVIAADADYKTATQFLYSFRTFSS
jgi:hypothetical protein